ncbi:hypothetical protein SEA_FIZZLES_103 [Microbacterium phage Fizzles]|nr:hypothetical protein SEA_FIZZLES_103 [Microbacterium phage Fizzles]
MSSLRKLTKQEAAAYAAHQAAVRAVVVARLDGATEDEIARLSRRAQAHRAQWQKLAVRLEVTEDRVYA